ncbi:hypothetical protein [Granulicella arctica]|uniref:hypothetical protein n=1 Tax=Granulicella arctica TaxID=940613 RepID=UPI0021E0D470|nr:hypothetical protein [Granulicella arctica]
MIHPPRPRLVLRLGVTGHRPVPGRPYDPPSVLAACSNVLATTEAALGHLHTATYDPHHQPQMILVSALAPGADQAAAEALLALPQADKTTRRLEVVLPFPHREYSRTMDESERIAYENLLTHANSVFRLCDFIPEDSKQASPLAAFRRDTRYQTIGEIIVHQADLLIAIWNGEPSRGLGGTGDVVLHALKIGVPIIWIDPATGDIRFIPSGAIQGDIFEWVRRHAHPFNAETLHAALHPILVPPRSNPKSHEEHGAHGRKAVEKEDSSYTLHDYLHHESVPGTTPWFIYQLFIAAPAQRASATLEEKAKRRQQRLRDRLKRWRLSTDYVKQLTEGAWEGYPMEERTASQVNLTGAWAAADAIATQLGHAYRSTYVLILGLSFLAVTTGLTGVVLHEQKPWFVFAELAILFTALSLYWLGRRAQNHQRWLRTRELAEQLRATWAMTLLGLGGRRTIRDIQRHWNGWFANAYLAESGLPNLDLSAPALQKVALSALTGIAEDQERYHQRNASILSAIHARLERVSRLSLVIAVANSLALLIFLLVTRHLGIDEKEGIERIILTMAALSAALPALGATAAALSHQGDFERFSKRSVQTSAALHDISRSLRHFIHSVGDQTDLERQTGKVPLFEELRQILLDLEIVLVADLNDWRFVYVTRAVPEPA